MSEADAFERAIAANPDDVAAHAAYADWLQDRDDPRGEFVAVQLALEESGRSHDDRDALKEREAEMLARYEREWLGDLAPHLLDTDGDRPRAEHWWARGFVTEVRAECLTFGFAQALAAAPAARFLRALRLENAYRAGEYPGDASPRAPLPPGATAPEPYFELIGSRCLDNLRSFQMGEGGADSDEPAPDAGAAAPGLEHLVAAVPRVEELQLLCDGYDSRALFELPNLTHLQVLRLVGLGPRYFDEFPAVPLDALARNPALGNLTHLLVHPEPHSPMSLLPLAGVRALVNSPWLKSLTHLQLRNSDVGDDGVSAIIASGVLTRLDRLDLRNGTITDYGAMMFARCDAAKRLRRLDLSRNAVTQGGLNILKRAGVNAVVNIVSTLNRRARDSHEADVRNRRGFYDPDARDGDME